MENVINLGIPHVGEKIFENIHTEGLLKCLTVSKTWETLIENVLAKRWQGKIFEAAEQGHAKLVELLLKRSTDLENELNDKKGIGKAPFAVACQNGHREAVELLLSASFDVNIDLNATRYYGCAPCTGFMLACARGHKNVVELLLNQPEGKIDFNAADNVEGRTAFMLAIIQGHKNVVKLILEHQDKKIDLNAKDHQGRTAFMLACEFERTQYVQLMMDYTEIDLNATDRYGHSAFMIACLYGNTDAVKLILDCKNVKIDLDETDDIGRTAYMLAYPYVQHLNRHHYELIRDLIRKHQRQK